MPVSDAGPRPRADELAVEPTAPRWARACAWVPGTGHCRNRACDASCTFRPHREAEARRLARWRRLRRMFARRPVR